MLLSASPPSPTPNAKAASANESSTADGHVISVARALSYNGFENALFVAGINAGRHVSPCFAGDTIYAWSEVAEKVPHATRTDWGFLRVRTLAAKDRNCADFPDKLPDGSYDPSILLDLDTWIVVPRV